MPTWMDFEGITLSEISQTEKDKYCIISLICGIFKKKKPKLTDLFTENRLVIVRGRVQGFGEKGEVKGYRLPVIK